MPLLCQMPVSPPCSSQVWPISDPDPGRSGSLCLGMKHKRAKVQLPLKLWSHSPLLWDPPRRFSAPRGWPAIPLVIIPTAAQHGGVKEAAGGSLSTDTGTLTLRLAAPQRVRIVVCNTAAWAGIFVLRALASATFICIRHRLLFSLVTPRPTRSGGCLPVLTPADRRTKTPAGRSRLRERPLLSVALRTGGLGHESRWPLPQPSNHPLTVHLEVLISQYLYV